MKLTKQSLSNYQDIQDIANNIIDPTIEDSISYLSDKMNDTIVFIDKLYNNFKDNIEYLEEVFDPLNNIELIPILDMDSITNRDKSSDLYKKYLELSVKRTYSIIISKIKFKIIFYCKKNYILFNNIINRFRTMCEFSKDRLKQLSKMKEFTIYLVLYDLNRQTSINSTDNIDIKNGHFNCSSGYTSLYISEYRNRQLMLVTRLPEHLGLFTHEMGHLLGYDFGVVVDNNEYLSLSGMVSKNKCSSSNLNPISSNLSNSITRNFEFMESINNYNTTILHSIFNAIEIKKNINKDINTINLARDLIRIEVIYSIYHSAKILFKNGFDSYDAFFNGKSDKKLEQKAYLFEYTIVRSLMFMNNDILELMDFKDMICRFTCKENICYYQKSLFINNNTIKLKSILNYFFSMLKRKNTLINMEYFCIDLIK